MVSIKALRASLVNKFGVRKYRITAAGEIHVYGTMPNSSQRGWYLFGYIGDAQTYAQL